MITRVVNVVTVAFVGLLAVTARADSFRDFAQLDSGRMHAGVRMQLRDDGGRRGILRLDASGKGGALIFTPEQWKQVLRAVQSKSGQAEAVSGGSLKVESSGAGVKLTMVPPSGDSYGPVAVELASASELQSAVAAVDAELAKKK